MLPSFLGDYEQGAVGLFKQLLKTKYHQDPQWQQVIVAILGQSSDEEDLIRPMKGLRFVLEDGLIYYWSEVDGQT
jgi:hypothetical protein